MANKYLNQFQLTYEKDSVTMYGSINIGGSGAVSSFAGGGIANVVKDATAGQYTITFSNQFSRFLALRVDNVKSTASSVATVQLLQDPATLQSDVASNQQLTIQCLDFAGSAVNPASGEQLLVVAVFRNTSVGPFDA